MRKNFTTIIIVLATVVLAGIAIFTAIKLYQSRQGTIAPNAPTSRPAAAGLKVCGETCTSDSECIPNGTVSGNPAVGCRNGICQNLGCLGKTEPGTLCTCSTLQACGQPCSGALGLCQAGSACRYIVGSVCTLTSSTSPTTYCVPEPVPSGWTKANCVARDQGNSYVLNSGANPTVPDLQAACAALVPTPTPAPSGTATPVPTPTPVSNCQLSFNITLITPTPVPTGTPTPTPTATPTITPTPTPVPQCNSGCTTTSDCPSSMVCSNGSCRNASCTDQTNCVCVTATPTPTPTPTTIAVNGCNGTCGSDTNCGSGMFCYITSGTSGYCRNPQCSTSSNCVCATNAPTATPTTIAYVPPTVTPAPSLPNSGETTPTLLGIIGGAVLLLIGLAVIL